MELSLLYSIPRTDFLDKFFLFFTKLPGSIEQLWLIVGITTMQFNYWCSVCVGATILLRDILFAPPLSIYWIKLVCHTLSVLLLLMLTFFYARKEWKTYSKRNLWMICIIDMPTS